MTFKDYFTRAYEPGLWSVEIITLLYMLYTTILILFYGHNLDHPYEMLILRLGVLAGGAAIWALYRLFPCRAFRIFRYVPILLLLISWYPENFDFCSQLPYKDHIFASIDQTLFGCQPALEFSRKVSSVFWCEAFNMGYYLYYYMMALTIFFYLFCRYEKADKAGFIFLGSFFLFYIIYQWLPVAGPQYYFQAVGQQTAALGVFPDVGNYFRTHLESIPLDVRGVFSRLVLSAQEAGERPTAAFPSSHVGMSTVVMIMAYRSRCKKLFFGMLPFYILLCCGTVYIKAHYLIDSIAGFFFACAFYFIMYKLYDLLQNTSYRRIIS